MGDGTLLPEVSEAFQATARARGFADDVRVDRRLVRLGGDRDVLGPDVARPAARVDLPADLVALGVNREGLEAGVGSGTLSSEGPARRSCVISGELAAEFLEGVRLATPVEPDGFELDIGRGHKDSVAELD